MSKIISNFYPNFVEIHNTTWNGTYGDVDIRLYDKNDNIIFNANDKCKWLSVFYNSEEYTNINKKINEIVSSLVKELIVIRGYEGAGAGWVISRTFYFDKENLPKYIHVEEEEHYFVLPHMERYDYRVYKNDILRYYTKVNKNTLKRNF